MINSFKSLFKSWSPEMLAEINIHFLKEREKKKSCAFHELIASPASAS